MASGGGFFRLFQTELGRNQGLVYQHDSTSVVGLLNLGPRIVLMLIGELVWTLASLSQGFVFFLGDSLVSWKAKKQATISRSSAETEYRALASTTSEVLWLQQLLKDFSIHLSEPPVIFCDNQAAIHIASIPIFHKRTKHIEIDCHFVREQLHTEAIKLLPVRTHNQLADMLTKALPLPSLSALLSKMAIKDIYKPP